MTTNNQVNHSINGKVLVEWATIAGECMSETKKNASTEVDGSHQRNQPILLPKRSAISVVVAIQSPPTINAERICNQT